MAAYGEVSMAAVTCGGRSRRAGGRSSASTSVGQARAVVVRARPAIRTEGPTLLTVRGGPG